MGRKKRVPIGALSPQGQTGRRNRQRGSSGERELAAKLSELTGLSWRRGLLQSRFGGKETADVVCDEVRGIHIEAKRRKKRMNLVPGMKQAIEDAAAKGQIPVIMGREDHGDWLVMLRLDDLLAVARLFAGMNGQPTRKKKVPPPPG